MDSNSIKLLSVTDVAERLGVDRDTVDLAMALGQLPYIQFGRRRVVVERDLERYLAGADTTTDAGQASRAAVDRPRSGGNA